ncbi:MAG TPA: DUF4160 domain-containing protein [Longimicrobiaceae bacterium]
MVTILRSGPFHVVIYPGDREHMPPHVHVFNADGEVKVSIGGEDTAPSVMLVFGMRKPDVRTALRIVEEKQEACLRAWRRYHGW